MGDRRHRNVFAAVIAALIAGVTACAAPERDNPFDPANAATAALLIVDRPQALPDANGLCPAPSPAEAPTWVEVLSSSRGRCLLLDASGSDAPGNPELVHTFYVLDTAGEPIGEPLASGAENLAALDPAVLRTLDVGRKLVFRVEVSLARDTRASAIAEAPLELTNAAPIALLGPSRTWAITTSGEFVEVTIADAGSWDPDGDSLTDRVWTVPEGFAVSGGCGNGDLSCTLELDRGTPREGLVALVVGDGRAFSAPAFQEISVRAMGPLATASAGQVLVRYAELDAAFLDLGGQHARAAFGGDPQARRILTFDSLRELALLEHPSGNELDRFPTSLGSADFELAMHPAAPQAWFVDRVGDEMEVFHVPLADDVISMQSIATLPADGPNFVDAAPDGLFWVSGLFVVPRVFVLSSAGLLGSVDTEPELVVTGLAARPGRLGEAWSIQSRSAFDSGTGESVAVRHVWTGSTLASEVFALEAQGVFGLGWIDEDRFWTLEGANGLCLVDATALESGASFESSILLRVPALTSGFYILPNPLTGGAAVQGFGNDVIHFVSARGAVRTRDTPGRVPSFIDDEGALWTTAGTGGLERGLGTGGIAREPSFSSFLPPVLDRDGGWIWVISAYPSILQAIVNEGEEVDRISLLQLGSEVEPLPFPLTLSIDPGSGSGWLTGLTFVGRLPGATLVHLDLDAPRSSPEAVVATKLVSDDLFPRTPDVFVRSDGDSLWVFADGPDGTGLYRVDRTGARSTERISTTEEGFGATDLSAARDGSSVCLVTREDGGTEAVLRVYRATPGQTVLEGTVTRPATEAISRRIAWGEDRCWLALTDGTDVEVVSLSGGTETPVFLEPAAGSPTAFEWHADGRLWLLTADSEPGFVPLRAEPGAGGWTVVRLPRHDFDELIDR